MMLRPATPLAVALFAAFALLLLSVLSTPIIKGIPLCSFEGVTFGVFGFCEANGNCSPIEIGYDTSSQFSQDDSTTFSLPAATRNTLSSALIIHPVACVLTLSMLIMSIVAHFHSPSHSVRYLLLVFITSIFTFLASLLSFLVDVLLFSPHMAFGSWLVLAATILVALAGIVSCAMRRTLVSRKSRKKRVAENAEMSGENFYNRQAVNVSSSVRQPTMPVVSGANGDGEKLPVFASFEKKDDRISDERIPLTSRSPSDRSPNGPPNDMMTPGDIRMMNAQPGPRRSPSVPRDQYGNPIGGPPEGYGPRRGPSFERMNPRGRGGMPPGGYRGRGNYGPPGRGGGYSPPQGRGGYGPPGRGGYGPPQGRGGYGPPPRGYGGSMRGRGPPPGYQYDRQGPYGVRGPSPGPPSAPGYSNPSLPNVAPGGFEAYNPDRSGSLPRAESPPPLPNMNGPTPPGQAVEMDATTGSPQHPPKEFGQFGQIRDSDADIAGMVGLQQAMAPNARRHDTYMSETSRYSQEGEYVPPRANWNAGRNSPRMPSPLNVPGRTRTPTTRSPPPAEAPNSNQYFEDIDPRFAEQPAQRAHPPPLQTSNSYEDIPQGARSPAESERSNFTSISQRGVNPRWHPPPPTLMPGYNGQQIPRRPPRNSTDQMVLNSNPDFALPGGRGSSPPRNNAGMTPGSAYPAL